MKAFKPSSNLDKNKVFILNRSDLEQRFDPQYYHFERRVQIENLRNSGHELLSLIEVAEFSKNLLTNNLDDLPYVGLEDIESSTGVYLGHSEKREFGTALRFVKGDVLFPKLRPYLNKVHFAEFDGVCSTEFAVLKARSVNSKFLSAYLRTPIILNQVKYMMSGNTLPRLQTEDVRNLLVPIPSKEIQKKVVSLVDEAYSLKKQNEAKAEKLLAGIDDYLLGELGIKLPPQLENSIKNRIFYTSLKEISGGRFDPKLYSCYVQSLLKCLVKGKYGFKTLKSLTTHSASGDWGFDKNDKINKDEYTECLVIRATEFDNKSNLILDGKRAKYRLISNSRLDSLDIKANDLLLEKSGGSENQPVGRIAVLDQEIVENHKICFSNFIHKIRVDKNSLLPQYAFNYLKVIHNIKITDAMQSQTNGIRNLIIAEYLNLPIPLPPLAKQTEISNHISKIRQKAQLLKDQTSLALDKANKEIENILLGS